jgi:hypothetical protein
VRAAHLPVVLHLALVLALGLSLPAFLDEWLRTAVGLLQ